MKKEVKIEYIKDWVKHDSLVLPEYGKKFVSQSFVKYYMTSIYALAQLNRCCRFLMDYIAIKMDDENRIATGVLFRQQFLEFIDQVTKGKVTYTEGSIRNALATLRQKKFLLKEQDKGGYFIVNPEFFFRASERERIDAIKITLELESDKKATQLRSGEH